MRKLFLLVALLGSTPAYANPVGEFLGGLFGYHGQSEVHHRSSNHVYTHGRHVRYSSSDTRSNHVGSGMVASFYGHGEKLSRHTASGAVFNPRAMTAAHKTLPFGTVLRVCHRGCVNVTVNDRGPFVRGRSLDLSYGAARAIGMGSTSAVSVQRLN